MSTLRVKKRNGKLEEICPDKITQCVQRCSSGLNKVSVDSVVSNAKVQFYDKIPTREIDKALVFSARDLIQNHPEYSYLAARILLSGIYKDVFRESADSDVFVLQYRKAFVSNLKYGIKNEKFDPRLADFDLKALASRIDPSKDLKFKYLGAQTLVDRYLSKVNDQIIETPQAFWMRVAMGLSLNAPNPTEMAIEIYEAMADHRYSHSTPTLFNSGTLHPQLSSCYLSTIEDSIGGIFGGIHGQALLSKYAGGLGVNWTEVRAKGGVIKSTGGKSTGVIPWMRIYNDTLVGVDQGGRRKGAGVAYLEPWHLDFEAFLDLRKNTGDEHLRCHDMHTSGWVPDLFMKRVEADEDWTMFDPSETPELANSWGDGFNCHYENFEADAQAGRIKNFKTIKAKDLWRKWLSSLFETGHPWVSFKDVSNERYSNQHEGMVRSSNLCVEICLHTHATVYDGQDLIKLGETAVCNLASLNIPEHINENGEIEFEKLRNTIAIAINALDAVIDINFYPTKEAENSNLKHRPVGLGIMGLQAALQKLGVVFDSEEAVEFSDRLMEFISYWAIHYSSKLAEEKGTYSTYKGSLWDQGLFPIDTYSHRVEDCSEAFYNFEFVNEWYKLREQVNEHGVRNSNMLAIAPTATIAHIQGVSNGIDPDKSVLWTLENLSGTFTIINEQFVYDMEARGLWDESLIEELKAVDGDVSKLSSVPDDLKALYKTCFDCDQHRLIDCAAERQKWIDQSQSLNLFYAGDSRKELSDIYFHAWKSGLKTTYYLRTVGASQTEKVSSQKACSITNPDCESCQ